MIAILTTVYLCVAIGFTGFVLLIMSIATLFGTIPNSEVFKAIGFGLTWPIWLVWGLFNWVYQTIRK